MFNGTRRSAPQPVFRNRSLDRRFRRQGWVVASLWDPSVVDGLVQLHADADLGGSDGYYVSMGSPAIPDRARVDAEVRSVLAPAILDLLVGYEDFVGTLVVKQPTGDSLVDPHQDGTCHDDSVVPGVVAWVPLTPMDSASGYLRVLSGSQRCFPGVLSTPPTPTPYQQCREELLAALEPVEVELGQALLFDSRLLHGSSTNRSGRMRLAGYLRFKPVESPLQHYWYDEGAKQVFGYEVPPDFFVGHQWGQEPAGRPFAERAVEVPAQMSMQTIRRRCRRSALLAR